MGHSGWDTQDETHGVGHTGRDIQDGTHRMGHTAWVTQDGTHMSETYMECNREYDTNRK